jgi:hypothetical protein
MDLAFFPSVEGSMTSEDGTVFWLHVKRECGSDLMLGFPHNEIAGIAESGPVHTAHGEHAKRKPEASAFKTTSFEIGRGPHGQAILTLTVGESGKLSFLLPADMPGQLSQALQKLAN